MEVLTAPMTVLLLYCFQEAPVASRSMSRSIGSVALLAAYCNIFLNPLIYIGLYDVVRRFHLDPPGFIKDYLIHRSPAKEFRKPVEI